MNFEFDFPTYTKSVSDKYSLLYGGYEQLISVVTYLWSVT